MKRPDTDMLLEIRGLKTYYINNQNVIRAVDDVSLELRRKERTGIAGESGSGKTQTMLSVMGLVYGAPGIVQGNIRLKGREILRDLPKFCKIEQSNGSIIIEKDIYGWQRNHEKQMSDLRGTAISMIFQEPKSALSPYFTVERQLFDTYSHYVKNPVKADFRELVLDTLGELQFSNPMDILVKYPHQLSGGESQRIVLALALLFKPEILIADEPTTALDAITRYRIVELFRKINESTSLSLLYVTHDLHILKELVTYVIVMFKGKIVEKGPINLILQENTDGVHPYTAFLRSFLSPECDAFNLLKKKSAESEMPAGSGCRYFERCTLCPKLSSAVQKKCKTEMPPLTELQQDHYAACWGKGV